MCDITMITAALGMGGTAGATAAGATAAASTAAAGAGFGLQQLGTLLAIGGSVAQGVSSYRAAKATAQELERQKAEEKALTAVKDQRTRQQFASKIRQQSAELAARGISSDSPTAVLLGQEAARELSFESQAIRSGGEATQRELSASQRAAKSRGTSALLKGTLGGVSTFLDAAPDVWPELLS